MKKKILFLGLLLSISYANANQQYTVKNGKSIPIEDPYKFKGEVVNIYSFADYDLIHIKDKDNNIIKGRFNTYKGMKNGLNKELATMDKKQFIKGKIYNFYCSNYNLYEYEYCK